MERKNVEIWRVVKGFEGYAVSSLGRVKSLNYNRTGREQILKPIKKDNGYLTVALSKNGVEKKYYVHRLVAEAFIPNPCPEKYDIINHKIEGDEGKLINTVENLEWCNYDYNNAYGTARERAAKARKGKLINRSDLSKTVYQYTKNYELVREWQSTMEVERQTGWHNENISKCCLGKIKSYKGYVWSYTRF